ncbi:MULTISPECIES: hypothetical protein [unclassified Rhizobium]|uniref:hypothetical protein n=1 Tax=unclassified Rhizobium TaxID=2613769 RepID=UPI0007F0993E|nr:MULTISPECIES: hypothetical protein [unclassified Rhizobium]ANM10401.1 hypothetical protein AMK05_CH02015 [Rhizobium sp. N324]ANM16886.1 hypothetical protein AMK06_CH01984 [Rhizobium sp. N541]ANM23271.1 hypothetical protein AMK07_CH01981 [Rhizobium sp. N941]OYD03731.1 hypothetical protein AMK08_CH101749 [Rhizobium sp. N4311]
MNIGPNFGNELIAAGLSGLPIAWGEDGDIECGALTDEQRAKLNLVIASHDPSKPDQSTFDRVTARQFKLQLLSAGLLDAVDTWVNHQPRDIQIAYEYSGAFVKDSPMMTAGFAAMGFSPQEIDAFFAAAAQL